jgi:hypothetical protein
MYEKKLVFTFVKQSKYLKVSFFGAELDREDHGSIPRNCDREGTGTI